MSLSKKIYKSISFSCSVYECLPRKIWQVLFNFYRENGGDLDDMDNMLIDYEQCKKFIEQTVKSEVPTNFLFGLHIATGITSWVNLGNELPMSFMLDHGHHLIGMGDKTGTIFYVVSDNQEI